MYIYVCVCVCVCVLCQRLAAGNRKVILTSAHCAHSSGHQRRMKRQRRTVRGGDAGGTVQTPRPADTNQQTNNWS